jgi:hypothetical protein
MVCIIGLVVSAFVFFRSPRPDERLPTRPDRPPPRRVVGA